MARKTCSLCHRKIRGEPLYSRWTKQYYCGVEHRSSCKSLRRKLIRNGTVDLEVENKNVVLAMRRNVK